MKKALKITSMILGIILIPIIVVAIWFPGLPMRLYVQFKYEFSESDFSEYEHYNVETPDSFVTVGDDMFSLRIPSNLEHSNSDDGEYNYTGDNIYLNFYRLYNDGTFFRYTSNTTLEQMKQYNNEMKCFNVPCPETNYAHAAFVHGFSHEDILVKERGDSEIILSYAEMRKDLDGIFEKSWHFSNSNGEGIVEYIGKNENNQRVYMLYFFSSSNLNCGYSVMIAVPESNEELAWQIINSVEYIW